MVLFYVALVFMIKQKNNSIKKLKPMSKKEYRRINLWVDLDFFNEIKKNAEESYLKIGTYVRQLIIQAIKSKKNNSISNDETNG
jgi:hypothetical protein